MRHLEGRLVICIAVLAVTCQGVFALESDQFTVPPDRLADVGPELSEMVWVELERILDELNGEITDHQAKARISTTEPGRRWRLKQIERLLSAEHLERTVHQRLGRGFPEARVERMLRERAPSFQAQPAMFVPAFDRSIYSTSGLVRPLLLVGVVPTVNTYGVYVGADKFGHLLQQGYEYRKAYRKAIRAGRRPDEATRLAIKIGVDQERGVFGNFPSGTYSNADLAANLAGLKFYIGLTEPVVIGSRLLQPLLRRTSDGWRFNESAAGRRHDRLLRPFVSAHLSEAMNPPRYDWTMRSGIRRGIRDRAEAWLTYHHTTVERETARQDEMRTWHDEPYGHSGYEGVITIADVVRGRDEGKKARRH